MAKPVRPGEFWGTTDGCVIFTKGYPVNGWVIAHYVDLASTPAEWSSTQCVEVSAISHRLQLSATALPNPEISEYDYLRLVHEIAGWQTQTRDTPDRERPLFKC